MHRPELLHWASDVPPRGELARVAAALERGELIALPTETVYGIAARADDARAVAKLSALKARDARQPLTWHVGDTRALERLGRVSPLARRLIARYWPGPLTLVLPGTPRGLEAAASDGWTGVRLPAHPTTARFLGELSFPVVATSANRHGQAPLASAAAVLEGFGELAFVIDGGPARLGEASVVLKLGPGHFELLRPGILDLAALREAAGLRIGFVCTGNTCRSPMAEALARARLAARLELPHTRLSDFGFALSSMGVFASPGAPASPLAVEVLRAQGIDLSGHRAREAQPDDLASLDVLYALARSHLEALEFLLPPEKLARATLLDPSGRDIPDPIGGPRDEYERAADSIARAVEARLDEWA